MPPHSPIFRKLLASAFLLIALTLGGLDFYLTRFIARTQARAVVSELAAEARILTAEAQATAAPGLEEWAKLAQRRARARVTVIDPAGAVLADSEHDPETMENHGQRTEVRAAMRGAIGSATRHSATLDRDLAYVAVPLEYGGRPGYVLRLAVPLGELDAAASAVRGPLLKASLVAAALALLLSYYFYRRLAGRVRRLQAFAEALPSGAHSETLAPDADDELGAMAVSLSGVAVRLRELLEQATLEARRREAILASMVEGVLALDGELRVIFCNDAFALSVGARVPVPERLPLLELVRDPALVDLLTGVLVTGEPAKARLRIAAPGSRSFEVQAAPLVASARRGAIVILHDITDLERLERVRKDFVANVSHELRTPLTAIRGYAETLLDGALEDEANRRRFVEVIRAHAIRLNNIASDLLALSDLESERPEPPPEPVSLLGALEAAIATVESEARVRQVTVQREHLDDAWVMGHKTRLEQAFVNLLDNAVKFNRPGGEVRVASETNGGVRVTISDTGIGIPSEDLPRIFERFYRVDRARSREVGGTGLGLSIVKHVIERMNGTVGVESALGKGSKFVVTLPASIL